MEKVNRLMDALERERLLQRRFMDKYKEDSSELGKIRWEIHKEMYFSLERIVERA